MSSSRIPRGGTPRRPSQLLMSLDPLHAARPTTPLFPTAEASLCGPVAHPFACERSGVPPLGSIARHGSESASRAPPWIASLDGTAGMSVLTACASCSSRRHNYMPGRTWPLQPAVVATALVLPVSCLIKTSVFSKHLFAHTFGGNSDGSRTNILVLDGWWWCVLPAP